MNFTEVVKVMVSEFGFDLTIPRISDRCTPLHLAIWYKCPEMAGLLISLGADRELKNSYGESCGEEYEKFVESHADTIETLFCNDHRYGIPIVPWTFVTACQLDALLLTSLARAVERRVGNLNTQKLA